MMCSHTNNAKCSDDAYRRVTSQMKYCDGVCHAIDRTENARDKYLAYTCGCIHSEGILESADWLDKSTEKEFDEDDVEDGGRPNMLVTTLAEDELDDENEVVGGGDVSVSSKKSDEDEEAECTTVDEDADDDWENKELVLDRDLVGIQDTVISGLDEDWDCKVEEEEGNDGLDDSTSAKTKWMTGEICEDKRFTSQYRLSNLDDCSRPVHTREYSTSPQPDLRVRQPC